eukprot:gene8275-biopygen8365
MTHRRGKVSRPTGVPCARCGRVRILYFWPGTYRGRMGRLITRRWERSVDPVIPEAWWEWLRSLPLSERFRRHRCGRLARATEERVMSDVISLVKEGQLGKAIRRLDPGVLAPLTPETLEALQALHPVGMGCWRAYWRPRWSLRRQRLRRSVGGCRRLRGLARRVVGKVVCRQMKTRFAAHFGAPPEAGAASSAAQVGVGVHGGAEMFIHSMVGARSAGGFSRMFEWIRSAEGTQQGDPLGPFFMAAPLQPAVLREILRAHREVYIIAYLDDIHILGEPEQVREAYDTAVPLLAGIGLELNVRKSAAFSLQERVGNNVPSGPNPETQNMEAVGRAAESLFNSDPADVATGGRDNNSASSQGLNLALPRPVETSQPEI